MILIINQGDKGTGTQGGGVGGGGGGSSTTTRVDDRAD